MNLDTYTSEMAKSIWDKAFFMDKIIGAKCVIDFGCADGAMIRYLSSLYPDITFIGYDISQKLIDRARTTPPYNANLMYFCGWESVDDLIEIVTRRFKPTEICINFSSVLHEVYSCTCGIGTIRDLVRELKPRYITIRDMYCDEYLPFTNPSLKTVWSPLPFRAREEFVKRFGTIYTWRDITHLLMKLQWVDNGWEDELKENYYSWDIDKFIDDIGGEYITSFECHYQLPYLGEKWKKEYGWYNPNIHTHAQFILRRDD
jgi:hypothetical protein